MHNQAGAIDHVKRQPEGASASQAIQPDFLFIGELAQETGSNPKTIRFYEREGLLMPVRHGRFRVYSRRNEQQLKSILRMRAMGIPLAQIREVLSRTGFEEDPLISSNFAALLKTHLGELDRRHQNILAEIKAAQEALASAEIHRASWRALANYPSARCKAE